MSEYDISRAFKRIENDLMDSMMRNLKRHQAEELEEGFDWEQWQVLQLKELERYRRENADKFTGDFAQINQRVEDLFRQTSEDAQAQEESRILDDIRKGKFKPKQHKDVRFFGVNDAKLDVLIERTKADFTKAEYAVLRGADDQYRKIIFDAQVYGNITNDYKRAVDMATKDYLANGLRTIEYKGGSRHNISDYAEMAIRTGNKRAYLMGEGNAHDEFGIHTVRVNRRTQACPKCVGFLGRVMVDDVYAGGTAKEASDLGVPLLSQAIAQGFLHPNCKDIYSLYIDGVSRPPKPWTQEEINQIVGDYNQEQQLKHAVAMAESYARMSKYSLDPGNQQKYQARADYWQARADEIRGGEPPKPVVSDKVTVLRDMIAEAEAEYKKAHDIEREWVSDLDSYKMHKSWAQLTKTDLDEVLADELRSAEADYAKDPHDINKRSLEKIKRVIERKDELEKGDKIKQLKAETRAKRKEIDKLKAELTAELDRIDKANQGTPSFDRENVVWSEAGKLLKYNLERRGVAYREVKLLDRELTDTEIIKKLAGGDQTDGSCMSLAQAYTANRCGLDVTDYRGGESQYVMSYSLRNIMHLDGLTPIFEQGETIRPAKAVLKHVEEGKEYYFVTGRHASIVRKVDGELQYLELQSATDSGWHAFEGDKVLWKGTALETKRHYTFSDTLKNRFACDRGTKYGRSYLVDIDQFKGSDEFRDLMGYVNTAEHKQKKGALGGIK